MAIPDLDARIAKLKGIKQEDESITIEHGTTPLAPPSAAGRGQIDVSIHSAQSSESIAAERAAMKAAPMRRATSIDMNPKSNPAAEVKVGSFILRETLLTGWELKYTPSAGRHQLVDAEGNVESSTAVILDLIYEDLLAIKHGSKKQS